MKVIHYFSWPGQKPDLKDFFRSIIIPYQDADRISRFEQICIWNTVFLIHSKKQLLLSVWKLDFRKTLFLLLYVVEDPWQKIQHLTFIHQLDALTGSGSWPERESCTYLDKKVTSGGSIPARLDLGDGSKDKPMTRFVLLWKSLQRSSKFFFWI